MNHRNRWLDFVLPVGIIACLLIIFVPLPAAIMDLLLAANISIAVIILLTSIYIRTPLELSVFPAILVATTIARIALNIGTTRLILSRGAIDGELAAGGVIQSFGSFVTGNNIAIGLVIFAIIVVVQFVVITKGATRISEVAARFALDGMPGRQMAIDAELSAGTIDADQARQLRQQMSAEADFYGAMDGASKFVRGDAIAGIAITTINIIGGLIIGLSQSMSVSEASATFTKLTIGDGLASQLPALLISIAAAMLVTRSNRQVNLPRESLQQLFSKPAVLLITAAFLGVLVFTKLPAIPLLLIVATCLAIAYVLMQEKRKTEYSSLQQTPPPKAQPTEVTIDKLLGNDILEMELGVGLIRLADPNQGGNLLASVTAVRKQIAESLGIVLPKVRIRDNLNLDRDQYRIKIQGTPINSGHIAADCLLAVDTGRATGPLDKGHVLGIFNDSLHAEPAYWIHPDSHDSAIAAGYILLTPTDVLADQLLTISQENAPALLTRDGTQQLIDEVAKTSPAVVGELIPELMNLGQVQRILKSLIGEGVSIRPLGLILETLGDHAANLHGHWERLEKVRLALAKQITLDLVSSDESQLTVFRISEELENRIAYSWDKKSTEIRLALSPLIIGRLVEALQDASRQLLATGQRPIALVSQSIRPVIAHLSHENGLGLIVLGKQEIPANLVRTIGEISTDQINLLESPAA